MNGFSLENYMSIYYSIFVGICAYITCDYLKLETNCSMFVI